MLKLALISLLSVIQDYLKVCTCAEMVTIVCEHIFTFLGVWMCSLTDGGGAAEWMQLECRVPEQLEFAVTPVS